MEHHCHNNKASPFKVDRKLKLASSVFLLLVILSFLPMFAALNQAIISYLSIIWWAVILGFFIGGVIDHFVPSNFIYRFLGQRNSGSILYAVLAGFLLSACSHGILAIAIQVYKKGASIPAVVAFLYQSA